MRRYRLEIYIAIIKTLASNGPLRLTRITQTTTVSPNSLKQVLKILIDNNLVEQASLGNTVVYNTTQKANWILSQVKELN